MLKVALTAFGASGKVFHAPMIADSFEFDFVACVQRSTNNVNTFYPDVRVFSGLDLLLREATDVDLVVINTPSDLHYSETVMCLDAGKHVLVEKPLVANFQQAHHLITLAKQKNLHLFCFQNRVLDSDFLTTKEVIESGILGSISSIKLNFNRFRPTFDANSWKEKLAPANGNLYNLGSHLLYQAITLFPKPQFIKAVIKSERQGSAIDDMFRIFLTYNSGLVIELSSSYMISDPIPKWEVRGDLGTYIKQDLDVQEDQLKAGMLPSDKAFGQEPESNISIVEFVNGSRQQVPILKGNYRLFYNNMAAIINGERIPKIAPAVLAAEVIRLINLAQESAVKQESLAL